MRAPHSSDHPRDILRERGIVARRGLGQSFLVSQAVMARMVEACRVSASDVILEIGTGLGHLTEQLADRAAAVVSVEIDRRFCDVARDRLAGRDNVTLLCADFLAGKHRINPVVTDAVRKAAQGLPVKVASNLPYQISSPAIVNLLEWELRVGEIDVMLQAEVAQRLSARPGTEHYGPLTVFAAYRADIEELFAAPASAFWPRPAVRSVFVRLLPRPPALSALSYEILAQVVQKLFRCRRKTLARALRLAWKDVDVKGLLEGLGLEPAMRPESLSVADFVRLANALTGDGGLRSDPG